MTDLLFQMAGGIGLFLMGMVLLTDGLKTFAGSALRGALTRFTGTPLKALVSGALITAVVQSSSATTVTVIGFVSAGLLTFPQALGVVFGASLGTTGTSWVVAGLGLKVNLGAYALPLVGVGGMLKLLGHGRYGALGLAVAGFGMIFLGIDTLQEGMQGVSGKFNLAALPSSGWLGHLLAMGIGLVLTVVMQSSSAAVATTLTALHTGALNFEQAASITIGAAIGTTVTGALAALGGTVPAKRTALAHVVFNLVTGLLALALLPWFLKLMTWAQGRGILEPGAMSLAAFHTAFVFLGVLLFLPWVKGFARGVEKLLPDKGPHLTKHLDRSLLHTPMVALEATRRALQKTAETLFKSLREIIRHGGQSQASLKTHTAEITEALETIQKFIAVIPAPSEGETSSELRVEQMHAIDHLLRLVPRLEVQEGVRKQFAEQRLAEPTRITLEILDLAEGAMHGRAEPGWDAQVEKGSAALGSMRRELRAEILQETAAGGSAPAKSLEQLDAVHWLDHTGYHTWRICHYLPPYQILPSNQMLAEGEA